MANTQLDNRNFLSPTGFKFTIEKAPGATFFCNQANIPALDLGVAIQSTYLKDIDIPGDKIRFGDLNISFLIDEDLSNYLEIQRWIRGLGYPEKLDQFEKWKDEDVLRKHFSKEGEEPFSDGILQVLNSNNVSNIEVRFRRMFPYSLSTLNFNASETDVNYFTAQASFKYTIYTIVGADGRTRL